MHGAWDYAYATTTTDLTNPSNTNPQPNTTNTYATKQPE